MGLGGTGAFEGGHFGVEVEGWSGVETSMEREVSWEEFVSVLVVDVGSQRRMEE